jgi:hypothetical protein
MRCLAVSSPASARHISASISANLGHSGVAVDHRILHFDGAPHGVYGAAELDDASVTGALDDTAVMHCDRRVNEVATKRPQPG